MAPSKTTTATMKIAIISLTLRAPFMNAFAPSVTLRRPSCPLESSLASTTFSSSASLFPTSSSTSSTTSSTSMLHNAKIIDAEFVHESDNDDDYSAADNNNNNNNNDEIMTLVEYSQNQDPEWKSMPVAFCDTESNTYIDCNLAFYAKDPLNSNVEYALGVPCEIPIVVALELDDNGENDAGNQVTNLSKVVPINPDEQSNNYNDGRDNHLQMSEEEKEEIFQTAAHALMEEFGPNIRVKKTPRVLTLEGDLEGLLGDWRDVLLGVQGGGNNKQAKKVGKKKVTDELSLEDAMTVIVNDDGEEEEDDFFEQIMKRDLGPDYMKFIEEDDDVDDELLKLFASEGNKDLDDLTEVLDFLNDDDDDDNSDTGKDDARQSSSSSSSTLPISDNVDLLQQLKPSAALRLLSFIGPNNKEYSVLRPLRPILFVGKEDPDDYTRRILLTEEERRRVLPRLESACREELEKSGFFLAGVGDDGEGNYE